LLEVVSEEEEAETTAEADFVVVGADCAYEVEYALGGIVIGFRVAVKDYRFCAFAGYGLFEGTGYAALFEIAEHEVYEGSVIFVADGELADFVDHEHAAA